MSEEIVEHPEIELKFTLPAGAPLPPTIDIGDWTPPRRLDLRATYYDSPERLLGSGGLTLRRRTGGDDAGWHLKYPGEDGFRHEVALPLDASGYAVPEAFRAMIGPIVENVPLVALAEVNTTRHQWELHEPEGRLLAYLCADDVVASGPGQALHWAELEVELAHGEPVETLQLLSAALGAIGCVPSGGGSKAGRALSGTRPRPLDGASSVADVILAYAGTQVGALQTYERGLRRGKAGAVHKSRVAARRLRSVLTNFGSAFDRGFRERLIADLRWFGLAAGDVRDVQVLASRFKADLADLAEQGQHEAASALSDRLAVDASVAKERLAEALGSQRYEDFQRRLGDLLAKPSLTPASSHPMVIVAPRTLASALDLVRTRLARAEAKPKAHHRWHQVRKAAKAARYCCDALATQYGEPAQEAAVRWEAVTEALGAAQDAVVAEQYLAGAGLGTAEHTPSVALTHQQEQWDAALAAGRPALAEALEADYTWAVTI